MGSSGGWDWAAYSNETTGRTPKGIRTFTKGITGSTYLARVCSVAITNVKVTTTYLGMYPVAPLDNASAGPWRVNVTVYVAAGDFPATGSVVVSGSWDNRVTSVPINVPARSNTSVMVTMDIASSVVELWWPAGSGLTRTHYAVDTRFEPSDGTAVVAHSRNIGFRTLALVTADDSTPAALSGVPGSGNLTMRLRINGANFFMRGSNWIPLEVRKAFFPYLYHDDECVRQRQTITLRINLATLIAFDAGPRISRQCASAGNGCHISSGRKHEHAPSLGWRRVATGCFFGCLRCRRRHAFCRCHVRITGKMSA